MRYISKLDKQAAFNLQKGWLSPTGDFLPIGEADHWLWPLKNYSKIKKWDTRGEIEKAIREARSAYPKNQDELFSYIMPPMYDNNFIRVGGDGFSGNRNSQTTQAIRKFIIYNVPDEELTEDVYFDFFSQGESWEMSYQQFLNRY